MQNTQTDKPTILHVIDKFSMEGSHPSSCTKLLADWAAFHDQARFKIKFCGLQRDIGGQYLEKRNLETHYIERGKISPVIATEIAALARQVDANIIHLHGYSAANFGRLAGWRLGLPTIVHEHAILKVKPHQFMADMVLRSRTGCAVAISNAVREFMVRGRCIPRDRIRVIHNGIKLDEFGHVAPERQQALRNQLGIPADKVVIGSVTRLREEKGNRYMLEAAAHLMTQFPQAIFLVIGDGPDRAALEQQARDLQLPPERLLMPGFLDDIPAALAIMDIAVVASIREGLSLAVLEAMASSKPIVATRVGGILELVAHEETAILVRPADPVAISTGIARLLTATDSAATIACRAHERSRQFSIENNVRKLEDLYDQLIESQRAEAAAPYSRAA